MRKIAHDSYYLPLTVKFYSILNMKYMDCLWDSLQFELLNVMKSISNTMLFKNIFLIIYVLDEF